MDIKIRLDESNIEHTWLTVFINGKNCGQLCMSTEDAVHFDMILSHGTSPTMDTIVTTGKIYDPNES